jgi:hypothetical protein
MFSSCIPEKLTDSPERRGRVREMVEEGKSSLGGY